MRQADCDRQLPTDCPILGEFSEMGHAVPEGAALKLPIMDKVVPRLLICHVPRQVAASGTVQGEVKA
jgi:hypothetical protein